MPVTAPFQSISLLFILQADKAAIEFMRAVFRTEIALTTGACEKRRAHAIIGVAR
ncbi:MAG TPA: hypothetical protein VJ692_08995 [Nitrospiraceae bacterium]|nr:hypothetical protein [Nitrospiraceae bacterium]